MEDELKREATEYFASGNALDETGDRAGAIRAWKEAIRLDPEHAAAHFNLGVAFAEDGDSDLAIEQLREAIRLEPFDSEAQRELADVYLDADRPDDAINVLRQSLNVVPGDAETASALAAIYLDQALWDQASAALEAGGMLEQDADLWYDLGKGYSTAGSSQDAVLAYRRALICHPGHRAAEEALERMGVPTEEPTDPDENA